MLTDDSPSFHPKSFEYAFMNTRLVYQFDTYKLMEKRQENFLHFQPDNPFSGKEGIKKALPVCSTRISSGSSM